MSDRRTSLAKWVGELAPEMRRELGPPPSPEELDAYAEGRLTEEEAEWIREDLTWRRESRETILDLVSFPDVQPPRKEDGLTEDELREAWRRLEARIGEEPAPSVAKVLRGHFAGRVRVPTLLAAIFFLTTVGLSLWSFFLHRQLSTPQVLDDIVGVASVEVRGETNPIVVSRGTGPLVLSLTLTDRTPYRRYFVEIIDAQGDEVWRGGGSRTSAGPVAVLLLRRDFLGAGDCRIRLYGLHDDEQKLLEEYEIRVESP